MLERIKAHPYDYLYASKVVGHDWDSAAALYLEECAKRGARLSTLRGYKYLDGYDVSDNNTKATPYAKQLISLRQQIGDRVIYPISSNTVYANNSNKMFYDELRFFSSKIDNTTATLPWSSMTGSNKVSAKRYFEGMMAFHSQSDWNTNYGKFL